MKKQLLVPCLLFLGIFFYTQSALAFVNNRYLAYGKKAVAGVPEKPQVLGSYTVSDTYITSLVTNAINKMVAQGLFKGQKGDKGDPGQSGVALSISQPADGMAAPAAIVYNSNIPGNIAGFTELSGGDVTAGSSLTVTGPAVFSASTQVVSGASLEVDSDANFTASTTMADLNVPTIESPSGAYLSPGGDWVNASSRDLKTNLATVSPQSVLTEINSLPIYTWNYKTQNVSSTHMGPMAQDFYNIFGLGDSSSSISTIDPSGVALAGIQALDQKIASLTDFSWISAAIKNLGVEIDDGIIKVESLVADSVSTGRLEVGSNSKPTGITIYDTVTGQPVCIYSANNVLQERAGNCQTALTSTAPSPAPIVPAATSIPEQIPLVNQSPTSTDTPTSSTDSIVAEPTTTGTSVLTQIPSNDLVPTSTAVDVTKASSTNN